MCLLVKGGAKSRLHCLLYLMMVNGFFFGRLGSIMDSKISVCHYMEKMTKNTDIYSLQHLGKKQQHRWGA